MRKQSVGSFPSKSHQDNLREKVYDLGYSNLTPDDKKHWHAYDYGFRRAMLNDHHEHSPLDRHGEWFQEYLVRQAVDYYRARGLKRSA